MKYIQLVYFFIVIYNEVLFMHIFILWWPKRLLHKNNLLHVWPWTFDWPNCKIHYGACCIKYGYGHAFCKLCTFCKLFILACLLMNVKNNELLHTYKVILCKVFCVWKCDMFSQKNFLINLFYVLMLKWPLK